ncbi:hypothetical protein ADL01_21595 [Streptomyces sp. NRRL WC-3618]|uniref:hypothetical protein n=1 Tax=Streptomyces sp. NRRL WC-3618 TaxID=1519490 RepID=UPI0006AE8E09|nr:hypothetical protein [Streptomyces sp. NRRL WC-3618]KOV69972.1 hypothetical protein ADL01_21595 [Streptomyces sp. NRRL WC-3618]
MSPAPTPAPARFRDPRSTVYDFLGSVLVRCPRCERAAYVQRDPHRAHHKTPSVFFASRRLVCGGCGLSRMWSGGSVEFSVGTAVPACDPYFRLPVWLQTETRHGWLWAYNLEHLTSIRQFVAASLRERAPWCDDTGRKMTLVARLPVWVKSAKNRTEVLRAVDRIQTTLSASRPPDGR